MSRKIYDFSLGYYLLRCVTDVNILSSFRKYRFVGKEKLPKDGPIIFAPNHCDALMDPLTALTITPKAKVFVARADVFSKPLLFKMLTFLKMMPINRRRDGIRNMTKTNETIEKSIEVLNHGMDFCIMPEGTHRSMHSLLPIGKGVARVAYGALPGQKDGKPLYIVPLGIEYGDYFRFRSTMLAHVGDPINVGELLAAHPDISEHDAMELIRAEVAEGLKKNIVYIEDNDDYDPVWTLARIESGKVPGCMLEKRFEANKAAVAKIEKYRAEHHEEAQKLFDRARAFERKRRIAKVSYGSLHSKCLSLKALLCSLLALALLPLGAAAAVLTSPVWGIAEKLNSKMKDRTFRNSLRCGFITLGWSFITLITFIVLLCCIKWYWALLIFVVMAFVPYWVYDYQELVRMTFSHWRYLFNPQLRNDYVKIVEELNKI